MPGAFPGEEVEVEILGQGAHRAFGRLLTVNRSHLGRVKPPCTLTAVCGGCPWMGLAQPHQLAAKVEIFREMLRQSLPTALTCLQPPVASPLQLGYRRRARFTFGGERTELSLGAYAAGSHTLIDVGGCPVTDPALLMARDHIGQVLDLTSLPPWDEKSATGVLRHLVLQINPVSGAILALIVAGRETLEVGGKSIAIPWQRFARSLLTPGEKPGISSVFLNLNPSPGNNLLGPETRHLAGDETLTLNLGGPTLTLPADGFSQVNHEAATLLYEHVAHLAGGGSLLLDLYSGVGAITLQLAPRFERALGIEWSPSAVEAARRGATQQHLTGVEFFAGDVHAVLKTLPPEKGATVILNPPRKGAGPEVLAEVMRWAPSRLIYVSCGPQALVRDLEQLTGAGLHLVSLTPFDFFPQTPHLEVVAHLEAGPLP